MNEDKEKLVSLIQVKKKAEGNSANSGTDYCERSKNLNFIHTDYVGKLLNENNFFLGNESFESIAKANYIILLV